jgi:hypothetical protein
MDDRSKIAEALDARFGQCWQGSSRERLIEGIAEAVQQASRKANELLATGVRRALRDVGLEEAARAVIKDLTERLALERPPEEFVCGTPMLMEMRKAGRRIVLVNKRPPQSG